MHHDRNHRAPVHTLSQQLDTRFDPDLGAIWLDMQSAPRPCFTPRLLEELRRYQRMLENRQGHWCHAGAMRRVDYQVLTSSVPGIFNLGGDLDRFLGWITERDRGALASYARACIDVLYPNAVNYHLPITTIALVRGQALGGGFEAALSSSVIIAEAGAQLGLPEILFNLFPGMGGYHLLKRRLSPAKAEEMLLNGRVYSASEMFEMGVIDVLAEDGEGKEALYGKIAECEKHRNGRLAMQEVMARTEPVVYDELLDVCQIWVKAAMGLSEKDLRMMGRLVKAQDRKIEAASVSSPDNLQKIA